MVAPINKDYEAPKNYKEWDDGEYVTTSIEFTSVDDNGHPILKQQKNGLHARFNFMIIDPATNEVTAGPNHGMQLHEFAAFAIAFKVQFPDIPNETDAQAVSNFLTQVKQILDASPNSTKIYVKDKWVKSVVGMSITEGFYNFRIAGIASKNEQGQPSWFIKTWPDGRTDMKVRLIIEILTGNQGTPTPFRGMRIFTEADYGLTYDPQTQLLDWEKTGTGQWNANAKRASMMYQVTAPTMFDPWEPTDPTNIIPYWMSHWGSDVTRPLFGKIEANTSKSGMVFYRVNFEDVEECILPPSVLGLEGEQRAPAPAAPVAPPQPPANPVQQQASVGQDQAPVQQSSVNIKTDNELDRNARRALFEVMANGDASAIDPNLQVTPPIASFADTHLTPLKAAGKIEGVRLSEATIDDVIRILHALTESETVDDTVKAAAKKQHEAVSLSLIGMDNNTVEASDSPW